MEESVTKKEIKSKSILRPKTSKGVVFKKTNKHSTIIDNKDNNMNKKDKMKKNENLLFSKFDFTNDFMKQERKAFQIKLKNLNKIKLLENNIDKLYNWENLFNNYTPTRSYISLKNSLNKEETTKEINENKGFESPILLVDLPEPQMNLFFKRQNSHNYNSLSHDKHIHLNSNKNNLNIRPVSMYSPREENSCFYYSNTFSDYYKEDFKTFCEKIPVLKAKLKIRPGKLKKEVYNKNYGLRKKYKILEEKRKDKNIIFNKEHLIIAGKRKNPIPLIKNVISQKYNSQNNFEENENKLNNNIENNKNEIYNNFGNYLLLSYYDINDPSLALFNQNLTNDIKKIKNNINFQKNPNINNIKAYKSNAISLSKEKQAQKNDHLQKKQKLIKTQNPHLKMELGIGDINNKISYTNISKMKKRNLTTNNVIKTILKKDSIKPENTHPYSFPIKTSSDVGNISYNRIKKFIKNKQFINKLKYYYNPIPQPLLTIKTDTSSTDKSDIELIWDSKKIKPKKNFSLFESLYDKSTEKTIHHQWDKNGNLISNKNTKKDNIIYFNNCIRTKFNKELTTFRLNFDNNCFYPINAFNKGNMEYYKMKNKKDFGNKKDEENNKDTNINININENSYDFETMNNN